jgi:hypothetical protein
MPSAKTKRKRRNAAAAPRAVPSTRRERRAARGREAAELRRRRARSLGTDGERPPGLFGAVPVSEVAIFAGMVAAIVGFLERADSALVVGLAICGLGVMEVTGREHFTGYRSHSALLAGIPAVAIEAGIVAGFGEPGQRGVLLLIVVPVFAFLFWVLRRRFLIARQARVARAARATAPPPRVS